MYETIKPKDFDFLSDDDKELLNRITAYSEKVLGNIDPEKVRISEQIDKLKPVMEEIAAERNIALEDVFIKYMDLASLVAAKKDQQFKADFKDFGIVDFK